MYYTCHYLHQSSLCKPCAKQRALLVSGVRTFVSWANGFSEHGRSQRRCLGADAEPLNNTIPCKHRYTVWIDVDANGTPDSYSRLIGGSCSVSGPKTTLQSALLLTLAVPHSELSRTGLQPTSPVGVRWQTVGVVQNSFEDPQSITVFETRNPQYCTVQ